MKYLSNAKINLNLMITGIDDKGYHLLYSVVAPIRLYDEIEIDLINEDKVILTCNDNKIPVDEKNIIIKCIKELKKHKDIKPGFRIKLLKNIPDEAGLGGGSSNGATVLKAINEMLNLKISKEELARIGGNVGADIPFFIYNEVSLMEGVGDKLTKIEKNEFDPFILLVKPNVGINTKQAFELYDKMIKTKEYTPLILHKLIEKNETDSINEYVKNDLQRVANIFVPEIKKITKLLVDFGAYASCMSGSGSCCFGLFEEEKKVNEAYEKLKEKYDFVKITKIL